jgi:hypothetical protein
MKEKILALLQAQFAGVRKDGLNHIANVLAFQVNTEDEAKTLVGKLTAEQVNSFITDWRKEADAEITKANKSYEAGLRQKYDFTEKKTEPANPTLPEPGKEVKDIDAAAIQKLVTDAIAAATKPLLEKVSAFEGANITASRRELLVKELELVPESYKAKVLKDFDRMTFADNDKFNEYLNETKTDVATFTQELADKGLSGQSKPYFGTTNQDGVSAGVQDYIKAQAEADKKLTGKEI